MAAAGVPLSVAVPLPLSWKVTTLGNAPLSLMLAVGDPEAVIVNEPAAPVVKVVLAALVKAGAWFAVKFALTDCGCDMVTVVLAEFALATLPVQLVKVNPPLAVATRGTTVLGAKNVPEVGVIVPPPAGATEVVN